MKKLMFAVLVGFSFVASAQDADPAVASDTAKIERQAKALGVTVDEFQKLTAAEKKAKRAEKKAERDAKQAKALGLTVEEFQKLTSAERKAMREAKNAEKLAVQAKRANMSVEEFQKLTPAERKAKIAEARKSSKKSVKSKVE